MVIKIEISNKSAYTLVSLFVIIFLGFGVYAYNSELEPSIMGHSLNEIGFPSCSENQFLKYNGIEWTCENVITSVTYTSGSGISISSDNVISSTASISSDDIINTIRSSRQIVRAEKPSGYNSDSIHAYCPSGKKLIGGGCLCNYGYVASDHMNVGGNPETMFCSCYSPSRSVDRVIATAICI